MRRLTFRRRKYLDRKCVLDRRARYRRLCREAAFRRRKQEALSKRAIADPNRWLAPRVFGLGKDGDRSDVLSAIKALRHRIVNGSRPIVLDFHRTAKMYADGTLLFMAELRRLIRITEGRCEISANVPDNGKIAQVLKQIGLFDLLGTKCDVEVTESDVITWRYAHGHRVEGAKYDSILAGYEGEITPALGEQLYTGITEAMANVVNHAYEFPRLDGLSHQTAPEWWMFSQELDGKLTVVFCDLGAGIPATLPHKRVTLWKKIQLLGRTADGDIIDHAIQDSISRTKQSHRGKGLGQIVRVISETPGAKVAVLSNRGGITRGIGRQRLCYSDSIMGTLIYWQIPLRVQESS